MEQGIKSSLTVILVLIRIRMRVGGSKGFTGTFPTSHNIYYVKSRAGDVLENLCHIIIIYNILQYIKIRLLITF